MKRAIFLSSPGLIFITALISMYLVVPAVVSIFIEDNRYYIQLSLMTLVASIFILIGYKLRILDRRFLPSSPRIVINANFFHYLVWLLFIAFMLTAYITASSIPIISALQGASLSELSEERGAFLKGRIGVEAVLGYISTLFVGVLLPYSLASLFASKSKIRYLLLAIFLMYCVSFLQKALFLNAILPIIFVLALNRKNTSFSRNVLILFGLIMLLYLMTKLASGGSVEEYMGPDSVEHYFSAQYIPSSPIDHILWRVSAVWVFTAVDTLHVIDNQFDSKWLWGATSSFLAAVFFLKRIPLEKIVFEYQWSWNDIGNSNSVYITEAYANFGWPGIVAFSLFIGQSLRWFSRSSDSAFKAIWPLYCIALFSSGLIGTLLSNGYVLFFALGLLIKLSNHNQSPHRS
jgi:hypothetical protein